MSYLLNIYKGQKHEKFETLQPDTARKAYNVLPRFAALVILDWPSSTDKLTERDTPACNHAHPVLISSIRRFIGTSGRFGQLQKRDTLCLLVTARSQCDDCEIAGETCNPFHCRSPCARLLHTIKGERVLCQLVSTAQCKAPKASKVPKTGHFVAGNGCVPWKVCVHSRARTLLLHLLEIWGAQEFD